eukprot:5847405-Alexandrium_andersonii.AAC.1
MAENIAPVIIGATYSEARIDVIFDEEQGPEPYCPYCNKAIIPTWEHLAWDCERLGTGGDTRKPCDPLLARMCWPSLPDGYEWRDRDARQLKTVAIHLADIYRQIKAL